MLKKNLMVRKAEVKQTVDVIEGPTTRIKKTRKPRKVKNYRAFHYRGLPFFLYVQGDTTVISTPNEKGLPEARIQVPTEDYKSAVQKLARLIMAEKEISEFLVGNDKTNELEANNT